MIGRKITERREQIGLTQTDLARIMNVSPSRISDLERGAKTDCNVSTAKRLARALGCSIDYLVDTWDEGQEPAAAAPPAPGRAGARRGRPRKAAPLASASS